MLVSKSESKAKNFMAVISNELKFNKKLQDDFGGPFYGKGLQWNTEKIKIIGSEGDEATPSLSNEGIKGQLESSRPTCIILDDPIDKETAFSASAVYDFLETMEMTVLRRLEPGGKLMLIAHRYCKGDGFDGDGGLLNDFRFKDGAVVVPALDSDGNSTCPERWPNEKIDPLRFQEKTRYMWASEFMQNPMSREGCPFNVNWILPPTAANRYQNANRWTDIRPPVLDMSIDPAYSDERKGDYSGIWVAGQHPLDKFGIINYCLKKMEISGKFSETYGDLFLMLNARRMFVEINNARTLGDAIREYLKPKGVSPTRIIDVSAKTGKVSRIGDLEPFFRNDPSMNLSAKQFRMYWHYNLLDIYKETGWDPFWNEYVNWNPLIDGHDHILDAGAQLMFEGYVMRTFYSGRIYSH
jgi:hypothetical protein